MPVSDIGAIPTSAVPNSSGGCQSTRFKSNGALKAGVIKTSAGQMYGIQAFSTDETPVYLRLYNSATSPAASATPVWEGVIPGSASAIGSGFLKDWTTGLDEFPDGIAYRVVTGAADNNDDATASNEVVVNFEYR